MRWTTILGLTSGLVIAGAPQASSGDQLVAVVMRGKSSPGTAEIWPLGRWRNGRMEDISHSWGGQEQGSWKKLPLDAFPLKRLMPFTMYSDGKKVGVMHPARIFDWDCGLESGLTLGEGPWPKEVRTRAGEAEEWVALSHPTPDLGNVQSLSKQEIALVERRMPELAIRAMKQKWPDQAAGRLIRLQHKVFSLDRSGRCG
ncbi:MAG: hypothetical protein ACREP9_10945, partial [Candidatus Dormibacteraceae bacterium]